METGLQSGKNGMSRRSIFVLFLICGLSTAGTVVIGNPYVQLGVQVLLTVVFLAAFLFVKRRKKFESVREVFFAFLVFALAAVVGGVSSGIVFLTSSAGSGQTLGFVVDAVAVILFIIVFTRSTGRKLSSLYLQRGNLRLGLTIGISLFSVFTIGIVVGFEWIFGSSTANGFGRILSLLPLVLVAGFLNAPKEELWFRGLFLKRYEPLLGRKMSNVLQATVFTLAHFTTQYLQFGPLFFTSFIAVVFALGLGWGYIMQRTGSLLGSTLAHVGADVGIYLPLFLMIL